MGGGGSDGLQLVIIKRVAKCTVLGFILPEAECNHSWLATGRLHQSVVNRLHAPAEGRLLYVHALGGPAAQDCTG